jgi:hypothetical protein
VDKKELGKTKYQNAQVIALLYSIVFVGIIFWGYFNLLGALGPYLAVLVSTILAIFAWSIARFIGYDGNGIRGNFPAFVLMLIISGVGIFNSLMLNLEGRRIFSDRIEVAQERFNVLEVAALKEQKMQGIESKIKEVNSAKEALMAEIQSPGNCGNGQEAKRLIMQLKRLLVDLSLPSGKVDCNNPSSVKQYVDAYTQMIDVVLDNQDWNNKDLTAIISSTRDGRAKLACLKNGCSSTDTTNYGGTANLSNYAALLQDVNVNTSGIPDLMRIVTPRLEELEGEYSRNVEIYEKTAKTMPASIKPDLELDELRGIGEVSQILNLIIARADRITTYLYLLLAIGFDFLMVYFFANVLKNNVKNSKGKMAANGGW